MSKIPKLQLKTTEDALVFAENIIETVRDSLIVLDFNLRVISANKSFYETFKVKPEETIDQFIYDLGNKQWKIPKLQYLLESILPNNSGFYNYEIEHTFENIGKKTMLLNARRITQMHLILLAIEDITERRREQLNQKHLLDILDLTSDFVSLSDANTKNRIYMNKAGRDMCGIAANEDVTKLKISGNHPEWANTLLLEEAIPTAIRDGIWRGECALIDQNGTEIQVSNVIIAHKSSDGKVIHFSSIARNISEAKKNEAIERSLIKAKSDFISMITHELRSPIGAIKLGLDLILDVPAKNLNENQLNILTISKSSVARLVRLIDSTLDLQKLNSGTFSLDIEKHNINNLVQEVKSSMIRLTDEKNLYFNLCLDESLPPILFDRDKIIQVLVNLISNAVKFTDNGGITVSTSLLRDSVVVSVKDDGAGIKETDMPNLFMPFNQLGKAKNHKKGSSGLGLSISKTIIEAHDGKIWAESKVDEGALFSFSLCLLKLEADCGADKVYKKPIHINYLPDKTRCLL